MQSPTMAELKADIKRLDAEIEADNIERGYCLLPMPTEMKVSDVWAEEVHKRYWDDVKIFLTDYASLILQAQEVVALGESEKITVWRNAYEVASGCHDLIFKIQCKFIVKFLDTAATGDISTGYAMLAEMIAKEVSDYPYRVHEPVKGDYDGNYEEYYQTKREALQQWKIQRKQSMKS